MFVVAKRNVLRSRIGPAENYAILQIDMDAVKAGDGFDRLQIIIYRKEKDRADSKAEPARLLYPYHEEEEKERRTCFCWVRQCFDNASAILLLRGIN